VQADGLYQLEQFDNSGDAGDPYPGSSFNDKFTYLSNPNSNSYSGNNSFICIGNISPSSPIMTLDFITEPFGSSETDGDNIIPTDFELHQNYPNPFNPSTTIEIDLPDPGYVSLNIYNTNGRLVNRLLGDWYPAGLISTHWNGCDFNNNKVASGTYFYEVITGYDRKTKKMILIK
jgi:hypothetical protein